MTTTRYQVPALAFAAPDPWQALRARCQAIHAADRKARVGDSTLTESRHHQDISRLAAELANPLRNEARGYADAPEVRVTRPNRDHVALPSVRFSRVRQVWVPRTRVIGSRSTKTRPYRVRLTDHLVALEVETHNPFVRMSPELGERIYGLTLPVAISGTGDTCYWRADDERDQLVIRTRHGGHVLASRSERKAYVRWWQDQHVIAERVLALVTGQLVARRKSGPKARPMVAVSPDAPAVLQQTTSYREACQAALATPGRWHFANGLTLTREGERLTLALSGQVVRSRDDVPGAAGLLSWIQRTVKRWQADHDAALAEHVTAVPTLGAAMADVG